MQNPKPPQNAASGDNPQVPSTLFQDLTHSSVIVSALGYFVDIYDLVLFSIVRKPSLESLGVQGADLLSEGVFLINMQMMGMLLGGILWGIWGDKKGRISVLFGSILMYSVANILNAFVSDVPTYGALRLIAGIGLAGELGAAITLVSESLRKEHRGYATALIAGIGVSGAIAAGLVAQALNWQAAYIIGGVLGLGLLVLRVKTFESPLFHKLAHSHSESLSITQLQTEAPPKTPEIRRGDFLMLFNDGERFKRYLASILVGLPTWFIIGILVTFAPEITKELGPTGPVSAASGIMWAYGGLVIGDLASGFISQWIKSRKKVIVAFIVGLFAMVLAYLFAEGKSPQTYYLLCLGLGVFGGYWAVFVTVAAEQFGTNLRATVATTAPNFVRGLLVPMTLLFQSLQTSLGLRSAALVVGSLATGIALVAALSLKETFGRDLNFIEGDGIS